MDIKIIECLKKSGLSIKDIKKFIDMLGQGEKTLNERLKIFLDRREALKQELQNLQEILNIINYKCWYYEQACSFGTETFMKNIKVPEEFREARESLQAKIKFH